MHHIRHEYSLILFVQRIKATRKNSKHQYLRICIFKHNQNIPKLE